MTFEGVLQRPSWRVHAVVARGQGVHFEAVRVALLDERLDLRVCVVVGEKTTNDLWTDHVGSPGDDGRGETQGVSQQLGVFVLVVL